MAGNFACYNLNFAHGDISTAGTFFAFTLLGMNLNRGPSFILALFFNAAIAMVFYFCVLVPAQRREASQLSLGTFITGLFGSILFYLLMPIDIFGRGKPVYGPFEIRHHPRFIPTK